MGMATLLLEVGVALAIVAAVVVLIARVTQRDEIGPARTSSVEPPATAHWTAAHHSEAGTTRISVDLVDTDGHVRESRLVSAVEDADPDYDALFLEAIARAQARADVLNRAGEP